MNLMNINIPELNRQVASLTAERDQLTATNATLAKENETLSANVAALVADKERLATDNNMLSTQVKVAKQRLTDMEAEHATALTAKEAEVADRVKAEGAKEAARITASLGVPPVTTQTNNQPGANSETLLEQWEKAEGAAKTELWRKHKPEIIKQSQAKRK